MFLLLPPQHRPARLPGEPTPKFKSAGGQPLPAETGS
jgi:hypothetical protein